MKPLTLLIKPAAGLCNMNCGYCFYKAAGKKKQNSIMTERTVDELILKVKEYRPSFLTLMFQGGEPTLAGLDYFASFIKKVKQNIPVPVNFALQTNGLLIDDALAEFFRDNSFLIGLSLDGGRRTNDRYRLDMNGDSVFDKVLDAARLLEKHGVEYNILSVIDDKNADDIENTYAFFKKHNLRYLQFIPYIDEADNISLSPVKYESFLKKSFDLWYEDYIKGDYVSIRHIDNYISIILGYPPENCAMCGVCGNYYVIEADGDIYPCDFYCRDEYRLGSLYDRTPFDENEKHKEFIRQSLLIHKECERCDYYNLCRGGCRRDRSEDLLHNKYCQAYKAFFDYSLERMQKIAKLIVEE